MKQNGTWYTSFPNQGLISSDIGRLQPQVRELEEAVLGALMLESKAFESVCDILKPESFYDKSHELIYSAIEDLSRISKPIDMLTVTEQLRKRGDLDTVGGAFYISQLTSKIASSSNIEYHARIINQKYMARQLISLANKSMSLAFDESNDISDVIEDSAKEIDSLIEQLIGKSNGKHISEVIRKSSDEMYKRIDLARKNIRCGVDTGLSGINNLVNGWQPSELIIVAARPSMGKTALMLHFAKKAAISGVPVAIFSLEMSDVSLADRLTLSECDVSPRNFKSGYMTNQEIEAIERAKGSLYDLPIYIDDNPCVSIRYIRSRCKLLKKQGKCGLILVDYLQLAQEDGKEKIREREISAMSRLAKVTAKELQVPFILLSQINRECEKRSDKKPMLSDLRESGAIEQDADIVAFIHRPSYYGIQVSNKRGEIEENYAEFIVAKNRNGRTGIVKLRHNEGMTQFYDYDSSCNNLNIRYQETDNNPF